jgi:hypothetical protein
MTSVSRAIRVSLACIFAFSAFGCAANTTTEEVTATGAQALELCPAPGGGVQDGDFSPIDSPEETFADEEPVDGCDFGLIRHQTDPNFRVNLAAVPNHPQLEDTDVIYLMNASGASIAKIKKPTVGGTWRLEGTAANPNPRTDDTLNRSVRGFEVWDGETALAQKKPIDTTNARLHAVIEYTTSARPGPYQVRWVLEPKTR